MSIQAQQREHYGEGKQDTERDACTPSMLDAVERKIARGPIDDGPVWIDGRHAADTRQDEIAPGPIGKGSIVEKNEGVLIEGGKVVVLPVQDRVGRVCAGGEVDLGSRLVGKHGDGHQRSHWTRSPSRKPAL